VSVCRHTLLLRVLIAAVVLLGVTIPAAEAETPQQQQERLRAQRSAVAKDVDALKAADAKTTAELARLQGELSRRQTTANEANRAKARADADLREAKAAVEKARKRYETLNDQADALVVESFISPAGDVALDVFKAGSLTDAAVKRSLEEMQAESDAQLLRDLTSARHRLDADQDRKEEAAAKADASDARATKAVQQMKAARDKQQAYVAKVRKQLDAKLAEAEALKQVDAALSKQIAAQQAALAAQLPPAPAPSGDGSPTAIASVPGGLATVACPGGGSITVAGSIASQVAAMLGAANAAGVQLCGGGYRDPQEQIALRMAHCGTSYYAIYEMPSSECDPPTAPPGTSQHEVGLAIDFTCNGGGVVTTGDVCWDWLSAHASEYGLYNLPSESWHWSTTAT
jgi:LAS superfamily LD-carboxypeptidase LdcB